MFSENQYFLKKMAILLKIFWKKVDFYSCDFDIFYGSIGCATKFHADEIYFFLSISFRSKVIAFFVKKLPKLNILSVIAID